MPTKANLKGRSSTISNAYAISITPYITPTDIEVEKSYATLQIKEGQCAYCLGECTGKDHLKPLVRNGMPTGYITSIKNLVPCCSSCNSSKGAKEFSQWYLSSENIIRLRSKGLDDEKIQERYNILSAYENQIEEPLNYEELVGKDLWEEYKIRRKALIEKLNEEQTFCDTLGEIILKQLGEKDD